mmetsp:Transcript_125075/g.350257  ORF Transcript_125075/g.350257 Transcript_125075/m.350257 type:complete len:462 (-) Transcript_125075:753-2138(-)
MCCPARHTRAANHSERAVLPRSGRGADVGALAPNKLPLRAAPAVVRFAHSGGPAKEDNERPKVLTRPIPRQHLARSMLWATLRVVGVLLHLAFVVPVLHPALAAMAAGAPLVAPIVPPFVAVAVVGPLRGPLRPGAVVADLLAPLLLPLRALGVLAPLQGALGLLLVLDPGLVPLVAPRVRALLLGLLADAHALRAVLLRPRLPPRVAVRVLPALLRALLRLPLGPGLEPLVAALVAARLHRPRRALANDLAELLAVPLDVLRGLPTLVLVGLRLRAQAVVVPLLHGEVAVVAFALASPALAPCVAVAGALLGALRRAVRALRPLLVLALVAVVVPLALLDPLGAAAGVERLDAVLAPSVVARVLLPPLLQLLPPDLQDAGVRLLLFLPPLVPLGALPVVLAAVLAAAPDPPLQAEALARTRVSDLFELVEGLPLLGLLLLAIVVPLADGLPRTHVALCVD